MNCPNDFQLFVWVEQSGFYCIEINNYESGKICKDTISFDVLFQWLTILETKFTSNIYLAVSARFTRSRKLEENFIRKFTNVSYSDTYYIDDLFDIPQDNRVNNLLLNKYNDTNVVIMHLFKESSFQYELKSTFGDRYIGITLTDGENAKDLREEKNKDDPHVTADDVLSNEFTDFLEKRIKQYCS